MTIGGTLASARQEAGLTVEQVSARTRIRETVIHAIERDDFSLCGGNFYARGHIRSIARVVRIDPEPLVGEYDDAHGGAPQAVPVRPPFEATTPVRIRDRRSPNWSAAMIVVIVGIVGYAVFRAATGGESHQSVERVARPAPVTTARPSARPTTGRPNGDAVAQAPRGEVTVRVRAKRASWLDARDAKGKSLFSGVLRVGQSREWTARKHIRLLIGNGGGVALTVNGKDLGTPGRAGQVVRLTLDPGDPGNG